MNKLKILLIGLALLLPAAAIAQTTEPAAEPNQEPNRSSVVFQKTAASEPQPQPKPQPSRPVDMPVKIYPYGDIKIVAVVNGEIISTEDIENRAKAFVMSTRIPFNAETKKMITAKVIQAAVDEKLKLQEAASEGVEITPKDLDAALSNFEKSNNIPAGQLKKLLAKENVSYDVFREQMKSDLAWIRLVRKKMMSEGIISSREIEDGINQAVKDMATPKYMVSEIMISRANAKNLDDLVANLRHDPRFELYAAQFSESPSASGGGKLGWITSGQLPPALDSRLKNMKEGDVSDAVKIGENFYIIKLEKLFDPKKDKPEIPTKEEMRKFLENKKMEEFSAKYLHNMRQKAVIELRN